MSKALIPFLTAGYPSKKRCRELLQACAAGGADAIELGIPFSDPLADGPVIQETSQKALETGVTLGDAFSLAANFCDAPVLFMTYVNPVLRFGVDRFFKQARKSGLTGAIIPDLPPEEAGEVVPVSKRTEIPLIFLCSPTCTEERIRKIARESRSWIYMVAVRGVTGARKGVSSDLSVFVRRVRRQTRLPLYVGFGISSPADAARVSEFADGVIVGSALLKKVAGGSKPREIERYVASLRRAIE